MAIPINNTTSILDKDNTKKIGIKMPFQNSDDGYFDYTSLTLESVRENIIGLVKTRKGERLFQPDIDSGIGILLFENFSKLTSNRLQSAIKDAVEKYEPRALIQNITVNALENENAYTVNITYIPDNDVLEANLEVYLERTR